MKTGPRRTIKLAAQTGNVYGKQQHTPPQRNAANIVGNLALIALGLLLVAAVASGTFIFVWDQVKP